MVYDRNSRSGYGRGGSFDYGRDFGGGSDYSYSSARDYRSAGHGGGERGDRDRGHDADRWRSDERPAGLRDDDGFDYANRDGGRSGVGRQQTGRHDRSEYGARDYDRQRHGERGFEAGPGKADYYRGAEHGRAGEDRDRASGRGYGRQPQGYDYEERGFFDRAGDEVRSWFGDEQAERRREFDQRHDAREEGSRRGHHDEDYRNWRSSQMAALDRDYEDYRRENRSRFEREFAAWRTNRQGQRDALRNVAEHQEVVGSDGAHVGTVDKVRDDLILLTKNDADADGRHHSFSSSWISTVDEKVTLNRTAADAKQAWQDEDRNQAMFGYGDNHRAELGDTRPSTPVQSQGLG